MVTVRNLCCFILLSQGVKAVIDWLRLFDTTSFYVTLILRTVTDIQFFVLIIMVMITYSGCATYMLQLNATQDHENVIIDPVFNNFLIDSVLSQYLLMLGEFSMGGFENHVNTALCFFLFFITTFIMQITFLNMLIAIMGDTFDRVIEQRPTFSLKNKLMILAGFENIIRSDGVFDESKVFLYVVQPEKGVENDGNVDVDSTSMDWRGKVFYTHNLIKARTYQISEQINQIASEQNEKISELYDVVNEEQGKVQRQIDEKIDKILDTTTEMHKESQNQLEMAKVKQAASSTQILAGPEDEPVEKDDQIKSQIDGMKGKIDTMQANMKDMSEKLEAKVQEKLDAQDSKLAALQTDMKAILAHLNKQAGQNNE